MTANSPRVQSRPDWMSIHEASLLVGVSPATLRRWSDAGEIRAFTTPGGHRRFSRAAVASLLPAAVTEPSARGRRRAWWQVASQVAWFTDLDPTAQRDLRRHARRLSMALTTSIDAVHPGELASSLADAESSAAACAVVAAGAGIGLRETVEAFLSFRASYLRAILDTTTDQRDGSRASAAVIETATDAFDRLVCRAMRAHEAASSPA